MPLLAATSVAVAVATYRFYGSDEDQIGGPGWVDATRFERDLRLSPVMGKVYAKNLSIHADLDVDVISFDELDPTTQTYQHVKFAAPRLNENSSGSSRAVARAKCSGVTRKRLVAVPWL